MRVAISKFEYDVLSSISWEDVVDYMNKVINYKNLPIYGEYYFKVGTDGFDYYIDFRG